MSNRKEIATLIVERLETEKTRLKDDYAKTKNTIGYFYIDDFLVLDNSLLFYYRLFDVEYIDINLNDMTGGLAVGRGGVIRIKTDPLSNISNKKTVKEFKFPITFTASKKFYVPKYHDFNNEFFIMIFLIINY